LFRVCLPLARHISIPTEEVLIEAEKWKESNPLTEEQEAFLNERETVLLEWDCERTGRTPQSQASVARLTQASTPIVFEEMEPGDLFILYNGGKPRHIGVVADRNDGEVQIWDSGRSNKKSIDELGGIGSHDVQIDVLHGSLDSIRWTTSLDGQFDALGARRINF